MRINGIYINGFGIYCNENSAQNLPEGVIVFLGNNEGGKTTLMEYIRFILFGFPRRIKNELYYPCLRGGNHGGRINLTMQDGHKYTIERLEKKVIIIDDAGKSIQQEPSDYFFNGKVDRPIFENIFAIGLEDMKGLDVLSNQNVRGWTLTGIGAVSLPKILGDIDRKLGDLLKPRAKGAEINGILKEMDSTKKEIRQLQTESAGYTEQQKRLLELEAQIEQNRDKVKLISQRLRRIEQLEQARAPWLSRCSAEEKLKALEGASDFPPKGLERFEKLIEEIKDANIKKSSLQSQISKLETQMAMIRFDESIIKSKSSIEAIMNERQMLVEAIKDLPLRKGEAKNKEEELKKQLGDLGQNWDIKQLMQVDTSIQIRNQVQRFSRDMSQAEREFDQGQTYVKNLQEGEKDAKESNEIAKDSLENSPSPTISSIKEIRDRREILQKIHNLFYSRDTLNIQLNAKLESKQRETESIAMLEKQLGPSVAKIPAWLWITALSAGIIIGVILGVFKFYVFGMISLVLGALPIMIKSYLDRQRKIEEDRLNQIRLQIQDHRKIQEKIFDDIKAIENNLGDAYDGIRDLAAKIDLPETIEFTGIAEQAAKLDAAEETLRNWLSKEEKAKEMEDAWKKIQSQLIKAKQKADDSQKRLQDLSDDWIQWLKEHGFNEAIRPDEFETILQMVEKARATQKSLDESTQRVLQIEEYIDGICGKIQDAMKSCNIESIPDSVGVVEMDNLNKLLNSAIDNQQKLKEISDDLDDANSDVEKIDAELNSKQNDLDSLLNKAHADNEDDFRIRAELYEEMVEYKRLYDEGNLKLMTIAGNVEALTNLISELGENDPILLQSEKEKLTGELQELESQNSSDNQEIGGLKTRLEKMLQDEKLGELLFRQKSLQEQLRDAVKRWAKLVTTRYLLDKTRGKFERERQPKVIQEASKFIGMITEKPYKLISSVTDQNIYLEDEKTLSRRDEICLSSGLADQVYLAIRLGLAQEFAHHTEPLPIIFDDVFVRFDPKRQLGMAKVILDLANHHQVLMFSCHPEIRDIMENARTEAGFGNVSYYKINDGNIMRE